MFNKGLFNRLLFNRVLPLFKNAEEVNLLGELIGFRNLEGLFQPRLSLNGIRNLTIEQYGNFAYTKELDGSYVIHYYLDGEFVKILADGDADEVLNLLGELREVNKDGEN